MVNNSLFFSWHRGGACTRKDRSPKLAPATRWPTWAPPLPCQRQPRQPSRIGPLPLCPASEWINMPDSETVACRGEEVTAGRIREMA